MKRKIQILILAILSLTMFVCGVACTKEQPKNGPISPFVIARADVPDAYYGMEYDLSSLIIAEDGATYSVDSLYTKNGTEKTDVEFSGMKFTANLKNTYIYTVLKATKNGKDALSEEMRIRVLSKINYYLVDKADVPDAKPNTEYNLNSLIKQRQDGVTYAVSVYKLDTDGTTQIPVEVNDFKFMPSDNNSYYYAVITATKDGETDVSEPMRIRSITATIREDVTIAEELIPAAIYGEVYSLNNVIHRQPGITYTAKAYYIDGNNQTPITIENFKLVPTRARENFFVVITATNGLDTITCDPVEVSIDVPIDLLDKCFMESWEDNAIKETVNKDPQYVKIGNTSIKYNYKGNCNYYYNYGGIPFAYAEYMDVTDWSNAVLSFWIYNPNDYTLNLSNNIRHAASGISKDHTWGTKYDRVIAANGWTQVNYSLRALGITSRFMLNFTGSGSSDAWSLKLHSNEVPYSSTAGATEIEYNFYLDEVNIYNYSKEMFPDLETRTPEEIENGEVNDSVGDKADQFDLDGVEKFAHSGNYKVEINTNTDYVKEGLSSLKYTYVKNSGTSEPASNANRGRFLYYSGTIEDTPDILGVSSDIDWSDKVYVGFWFKQEYAVERNDVNMAFRMQNYNGTSWTSGFEMTFGSYNVNQNRPNNTEWQYVECNLTKLITDLHKSGVTKYRFALVTEIVANDAVFYIDGLSIYNNNKDDLNDLTVMNKTTVDGATVIKDITTFKVGSQSLKVTLVDDIKCEFLTKSTDDSSQDIYNIYKNSITDWSDVKIGFWLLLVKGNNFNLDVSLSNVQDGEYSNLSTKTVEMKASGNWQYIEVSFADAEFYTENVQNIAFSLVAHSTDISFHIDVFSIYSGTRIPS